MTAKARKKMYIKLFGVLVVAVIFGVSILIDHVAIPIFGIVILAFIALSGSNFLYDLGVPRVLSRRFAPVIGGIAYLVAILCLDKWTAVAVTGTLTLIITVLRLGFRQKLRGVRGNHPAQNWTEISYPAVCTISLLVGWGILGNYWLAFLPIAFVSWGDSAAGLARDYISIDNSPTICTMASMLIVCLCAAIFFHPYWIAMIGAAIATLSERFRPGFLKFWDDNMNIVATSLPTMAIMLNIS